MSKTLEFGPIGTHNGYILYITKDDNGEEQYCAYRVNDCEPLVKARTLDILKDALNTIDNADASGLRKMKPAILMKTDMIEFPQNCHVCDVRICFAAAAEESRPSDCPLVKMDLPEEEGR